MSRKPRMTGFARMLIVLLIAAPFAYIGASYYNGEDGIQNLKNLLGIGEKKEKIIVTTPDSATASESQVNEAIQKLKEDLQYAERRIDELEQENESLKEQLRKAKETIDELQN